MRPVNLLPDDGRRRKAAGSGDRPNGALAVLGVLGVLLVMLVGYVMTSNKINESKAQAAQARQEADRLEAETAQRGAFTSFAEIKTQRLATVMTTAQGRFDWERLMREVALVMPRGAWLQSTDASVTGTVDAATLAADPSAAAAAGPSATFVGCTARQTDVATMMTRLREMHRATEVKLNESGVEEGDAEIGVDSCGSFYKFDVTVMFEPSVPAQEAPRGAARVPASLGGGS